jgi:hypothetical protein
MKKLFLLLLFLLPIFLNAQNITIDERINDIYYWNGKLVARDQAWETSNLIHEATKKEIYNDNTFVMKRETNFDILYNSSYGFYVDVLEAFNKKSGT